MSSSFIAKLPRISHSCHFDQGQIRAIEDEALTDPTLEDFAKEMLARLTAITKEPRHEVYRAVFNVYSEALVHHLLKSRCGGRLRISKIKESDQPSPDFECELDIDRNGKAATLQFYIEVKALDIVHAKQRIPQMLDESMEVQIELDRQIAEGRPIAMAEG